MRQPPHVDTDYPGLAPTIEWQDYIGWDCLLKGRLTVDWALTQQSYLSWLNS